VGRRPRSAAKLLCEVCAASRWRTRRRPIGPTPHLQHGDHGQGPIGPQNPTTSGTVVGARRPWALAHGCGRGGTQEGVSVQRGTSVTRGRATSIKQGCGQHHPIGVAPGAFRAAHPSMRLLSRKPPPPPRRNGQPTSPPRRFRDAVWQTGAVGGDERGRTKTHWPNTSDGKIHQTRFRCDLRRGVELGGVERPQCRSVFRQIPGTRGPSTSTFARARRLDSGIVRQRWRLPLASSPERIMRPFAVWRASPPALCLSGCTGAAHQLQQTVSIQLEKAGGRGEARSFRARCTETGRWYTSSVDFERKRVRRSSLYCSAVRQRHGAGKRDEFSDVGHRRRGVGLIMWPAVVGEMSTHFGAYAFEMPHAMLARAR